MKELLKFKMRKGRPYVLVRWAVHDASGGAWAPRDNLTNCDSEEAIAAFERATGRSLPRRTAPPLPRRRQSRRQASRLTLRHLATLVRRSIPSSAAGSCIWECDHMDFI